MIQPTDFLDLLQKHDVSFFAGVPDSLLKNFCACVDDTFPTKQHIITANEGGAVAVATGYHLATGKIPLVYMQNSGLGNAVNPLLSLVDTDVYGIPMLLIIGWRGEPGAIDEPQHVKQGAVTPVMLDCMGIQYTTLPDSKEACEEVLTHTVAYIHERQAPHVLLVRKGTFAKHNNSKDEQTVDKAKMKREEVLSEVLELLPKDTVYVGTTGKLSRELFELREKRNEGHEKDFLTVGSMGHASQIALGVAEKSKRKTVVCLDGDGAALMHLGGFATIGAQKPNNFVHIIFNNGIHESVGGQRVAGKDVDYVTLAKSVGYGDAFRVKNTDGLHNLLNNISEYPKPILIECVIKSGSRKDLGRPTVTPKENKENFKNFLKST